MPREPALHQLPTIVPGSKAGIRVDVAACFNHMQIRLPCRRECTCPLDAAVGIVGTGNYQSRNPQRAPWDRTESGHLGVSVGTLGIRRGYEDNCRDPAPSDFELRLDCRVEL